jgi:hypothetical protein
MPNEMYWGARGVVLPDNVIWVTKQKHW